jgi:NADPH-dependent ferric siderophore reductase
VVGYHAKYMTDLPDTPLHVQFDDPVVVAAIVETVEHFNEDHGDTVLLVAGHLAGGDPRSPGEARIVGVGPSGVTFERLHDGRAHVARLELDPPLSDPFGIYDAVLLAVGAARAAAPEGVPLTSLERELAATSSLRAQPGTVRAVRPLTPTLLELDLEGLDDMVQVAPDTFVYVMVAVDGTSIDPELTIQDFSSQPDGGPVRGAYYTIRRRDPATGVVTFWVVLHDHAGGVGGWMRAARPGDQVVGWGPRPGFVPSPEAEAVLLVADETGWAAAAAIIESLPADVEVVARLEVGDPSGTPPMPTHPRLDLRWVVRTGEPGTGDELLEAVAAVDLGDPSRWAAFGGAESRQVSRVRRFVRRERGLDAHRVLMTGYWRREAGS